ncbi:MAG: amidohydrolase family protein [Bacteroidia bacterium]|nr:amidohydrolase family protein [Bacteroidia bacterium]
MNRKSLLLLVLFFLAFAIRSQTTFPNNGAPHPRHSVHAFINVSLFLDYETFINNGTLVIKDGLVFAAGEKVNVPKEAIVHDLKGKFIYPSFIDLFSDYGMPETGAQRPARNGPQMQSNVKGAYGWNQAIHAETEAHKLLQHQKDKADEYKKAGFGIVLTHKRDGIVRGSASLVNLSNKKENACIVKDRAAAVYSFSKGSSTQDYPSSLAGSIALLRQTHYDAQWYATAKENRDYNISLEEFNRLQQLPSLFETRDKYDIARIAQLGKEFGMNYLVKGSGNEYQRISDMKESGLKFILPLNFPDAYDVQDPFDAEMITLSELKHWELAPGNPSAFEKRFIPFCLSSSDLKNKEQFFPQLRKAIQYGLSEKMALKALTYQPAAFMNVQNQLGALKPGYQANFFISSASIFDEGAVVLQHWVLGEAETFYDPEKPDVRGEYVLKAGNNNYKVSIKGELSKPESKIQVDTSNRKFTFSFAPPLFSFSFLYDSLKTVRATGQYNANERKITGRGQWANGDWFDFEMLQNAAADSATTNLKKRPAQNLQLGKVIYPFTAYGEALPESEGAFRDSWTAFKTRYKAILIKNATVWTNRGDTVLQDYDVYVVDGRIVRIAPNIDAPKLAFAKIIDAKGKHLTPGIIDEHSHIALNGGVNEGTEASSAEVRMGDVIDPEDINIYRQLSGGVTTAQLLHGSANPIGGQSALIKLRWGQNAEGLKYEKAAPFIKFALGENVKQSNWGDHNVIRFPQSRMGVEQVYMDFFIRAKEYKTLKQNSGKGAVFRIDLELEALSEILENKRFITCHSYVQSEINMLLHVADSLGFKVNTFTHILEGYKVADKMKAHGVHASTFSDWWAYKNEVMEAIPYNAALLTKMGVVTAMNSDDAEMARRLNQEAAKAIKYGGVSETDALKMVTLNPAILLHIDDRVGSIQVGKTADLVVWTDNPLSVYAKADKTIIDGQIYFDREEDERLKAYIKSERARLIAKMLQEKQAGAGTQKVKSKPHRLYHCDTMETYGKEVLNSSELEVHD